MLHDAGAVEMTEDERDGKSAGMGFAIGEQSKRVEDSKTKYLHRKDAVCSPG